MKNLRLFSLHIQGNQIGDEGGIELMKTLKTMHALEILDLNLSENCIGNMGARGIITELWTMLTL